MQSESKRRYKHAAALILGAGTIVALSLGVPQCNAKTPTRTAAAKSKGALTAGASARRVSSVRSVSAEAQGELDSLKKQCLEGINEACAAYVQESGELTSGSGPSMALMRSNPPRNHCGNHICEGGLGENPVSCPADCTCLPPVTDEEKAYRKDFPCTPQTTEEIAKELETCAPYGDRGEGVAGGGDGKSLDVPTGGSGGAGGAGGAGGGCFGPVCGDGICQAPENFFNCRKDCRLPMYEGHLEAAIAEKERLYTCPEKATIRCTSGGASLASAYIDVFGGDGALFQNNDLNDPDAINTTWWIDPTYTIGDGVLPVVNDQGINLPCKPQYAAAIDGYQVSLVYNEAVDEAAPPGNWTGHTNELHCMYEHAAGASASHVPRFTINVSRNAAADGFTAAGNCHAGGTLGTFGCHH